MRILIVDDDLVCRLLLQALLSKVGNCDLAVDGGQGLAKLQASREEGGESYHLLCLDMRLPGIDGMTVLKHLRSEEKRLGIADENRTRVVITSANSEQELIIQAFEHGVDAFLTKPISIKSIMNQLVQLKLLDG